MFSSKNNSIQIVFACLSINLCTWATSYFQDKFCCAFFRSTIELIVSKREKVRVGIKGYNKDTRDTIKLGKLAKKWGFAQPFNENKLICQLHDN